MPILIKSSQRAMLTLLVAAAAILFAMGQASRSNFDVKSVSIAEANTLIDAGALVIDVRERDKYDYRHIPEALFIPLEVLRAGIPASITYAKSKPVVVYCGDGVTHGPEGTDLLQKAGFSNAVNIKRGIEGWAAAGLPVQR